MEDRTLSELYAGVLSHDWEKLLKALDCGENRVLVYSRGMDDIECPAYAKQGIKVCWKMFIGEEFATYIVSPDREFGFRDEAIAWLEKNGLGYFETKEDKDNG